MVFKKVFLVTYKYTCTPFKFAFCARYKPLFHICVSFARVWKRKGTPARW